MNKSATLFSVLAFFGVVAPALADVRVASMKELRDLPDGRMLTETSLSDSSFARIAKQSGRLKASIFKPGVYALFCGQWYEGYPVGSAWRPRPGRFTIKGAEYPVGQDGQKALAFTVTAPMSVAGVCEHRSELLLFKLN